MFLGSINLNFMPSLNLRQLRLDATTAAENCCKAPSTRVRMGIEFERPEIAGALTVPIAAGTIEAALKPFVDAAGASAFSHIQPAAAVPFLFLRM